LEEKTNNLFFEFTTSLPTSYIQESEEELNILLFIINGFIETCNNIKKKKKKKKKKKNIHYKWVYRDM